MRNDTEPRNLVTSRLLTTFVAALAAFLLGWSLRGALHAPSDAPRIVPLQDPVSAVTFEPKAETRLTEAPSLRQPVLTPQAPVTEVPRETEEPTREEALALLERALRAHPGTSDDTAQFEERYRGISLDAGGEAIRALSERARVLRDVLLADQMANGPFQERRHGDGQPGPHVTGSGASSVSLFLSQSIQADGSLMDRWTTLDSQSHPELLALERELEFLQDKVRIPMKRR